MRNPSIILIIGVYFNFVAAQNCNKTDIGVHLLECFPDVWSTREYNTSEEDPLQIVWRTFVQSIPAVNQTSQRVIPGEFLNLTLKTYQFEDFEATNPSPVWLMEKGSTVYVNLTNNIHIDYQEDTDEYQVNESEWDEHHWAINIHTHGMHISSEFMQDDPSREIKVGESGMYKFEIGGNHQGGYHWYHPHIEAVSEMTVGSGTSGPLVIETDLSGTEIPEEVADLVEIVLLISKIYPAKLIDLSDGFVNQFDFVNGVYPRENITDSTFKAEYNEDLENDLQILESNTNYTLVNGFLKPKIIMDANEWYRFSFLYVGGSDEEADLADVKFRIGKNNQMVAGEESDYGELNE
eukprot:augustus_masked-scaffold_9-processed-gene-0.44-mRNA-1 protein AED:1.00 eAED:1.00 QI:0/-1/0/0/-1/1/1/0/349